MYKPRPDKQKNDKDVVKVCKQCGQTKAHGWVRDDRKRNGGCPKAICRECTAMQWRERRRHPTEKKPDLVKLCKTCGTESPHDWLKDCRNAEGGYYRAECRVCHNARAVMNYDELKRAAIAYKGGKCSHCGLRHDCPAVYDFHHRDFREKEYRFGDLCKCKRIAQFSDLTPELDKCDLLCAICHRVLHYTERSYRKEAGKSIPAPSQVRATPLPVPDS